MGIIPNIFMCELPNAYLTKKNQLRCIFQGVTSKPTIHNGIQCRTQEI